MDQSKKQLRARLRLGLRILLCSVAGIGMWKAIAASAETATLQSAYLRLAKTVGHLPIKDPKKVYVLALPSEGANIWRFRLYLPANYAWNEVYYNGRISATTPRVEYASGGASGTGARAEPIDFLITIGCFKEERGWELHTNSYSSRGCSGLNQKLAKLLENPASLIIELVGENGPAEFAVHEPICLLRVRDSKPVKEQTGSDPLYEGFYYYLVPKPALNDFEAIQQGRR